jgi:pilus assembly protein CpaD
MSMPRTPLQFSPAVRALAAVAFASTLTACAADRVATGSTQPHDYRQRHPIVLTEGSHTLDVFSRGAGGLGPRQRDDVRAFAAEYRRSGHGAVVAYIPSGPGAGVHYTMDQVREALAEGGLSGASLVVTSYAVSDPAIAAPIRLTFGRLKATVASQCGTWPHDLGISDPRQQASNQTYWNFGCSMQANVAAQVADPVDLVRGRTESRPDSIRRGKVIEAIREGKDPSTQYRQEGTKINQAVGN